MVPLFVVPFAWDKMGILSLYIPTTLSLFIPNFTPFHRPILSLYVPPILSLPIPILSLYAPLILSLYVPTTLSLCVPVLSLPIPHFVPLCPYFVPLCPYFVPLHPHVVPLHPHVVPLCPTILSVPTNLPILSPCVPVLSPCVPMLSLCIPILSLYVLPILSLYIPLCCPLVSPLCPLVSPFSPFPPPFSPFPPPFPPCPSPPPHPFVSPFCPRVPPQDSSDYPLSLSTGPWRRFRASFGAVVTAVALRSRHAVLYDGFLLGGLTALLTSLADSQVRAFRHTATLAAMKLMTALVEVALGLSQRRDNTWRLYEAERGKSPPRRAPGKLEALQETLREHQEQQEEIEAMMNTIFKGVFVHRYRDVVPDVRALCMEELGTWMCSFPASFLTDGHLKYLGWTLHDKQGEVRLRCVRALQGLYARRDTAAHMELFTGRFKAHLVSMVQDKDPVVAVEVVKLLTVMLDTVAEALTEADCHRVYPAVFCSRRPLATAAGLFLYRSLLSPRHEGDTEPSPGSGDNRTFFRLLLTFFIESELHQHAAYLVDSLWDCAGTQLRDWDTAGGLLLEEAPEEVPPPALSDQQEKALVEILAASAKRAAGEGPPVGRGPPRKAPPKGRRAVTEQRSRLSLCLAPILPRLLAKPLEQALAQLQELVQKHTGPEVLGAASRALGALCDPRLPLRGRGELVRSRLGDLLGERCHRLLRLPSLDEEELYSAAATLKRLSVLFNAHDLTPWQLFEPCTLLLRRAADTGEVPPQLLVPAITCTHFHILWELSRLANTDVPQEQLLSLKDKTTSFCALCQSCLSNGDAGVREQAFVVLSDLLLVLGPSGTRGAGAALAPLRLVPDVELRSQLAAVLLDHVFSPGDRDGDEPDAAEAHMEDLHRRRMLLAGFCKLIIYNVLEPSAASDVLKYYDKFHAEYGDIIKETLACIRRMDGQEWARVVLLSLQQVMTELLMEHGPGVRGVPAFGGLWDLGRRLSLFFGPRPQPNRQVLLRLHRDGIAFALQEGPEGGPGGIRGGPPCTCPSWRCSASSPPACCPPTEPCC
ncbi:cohesin subunit SA-3-like isoform X3 [Anas platyrhynchos]|uniref:cohesin subunit SA-3-like isoform X3 n=1 Tax=Anas platyrhynchos TaxID=8839 RepID=UPI003AF2FD91